MLAVVVQENFEILNITHSLPEGANKPFQITHVSGRINLKDALPDFVRGRII
jgi:hypothetical protein